MPHTNSPRIDRDQLARGFEPRLLKAGEVLVSQGDPGGSVGAGGTHHDRLIQRPPRNR